MANLLRVNGSTSNIIRVHIKDLSTPGAGKTGLAYNTSGLIIGTIANNEATATAYTVTESTIETITTLGTYAAPTATKCRFKEVDATNCPGLYEIQLANARFAVTGAKSLLVYLSGAADMEVAIFEVDLAATMPATEQMVTAYELDGSVYRLTQNAVEKVSTGSTTVQTDGTIPSIPADWPRS